MNVQQANSKLIEHELSIVKDLSGSARVTLNDTGWDSRVYIVENGLYVFKFPRSEKVREQYAHEIAALDIAQHIGGIHVPKIIWRDAMNNYFGYEGVQGKPLSKILPSLHEEQKAKIGRQIGVFLRVFHEQRFDGVKEKSVENEIRQLHEWYQLAKPIIRQHFSHQEFTQLEKLVHESWPARMQSLPLTPALCHGDLHTDNMFYDAIQGLGVIDFGDVAIYDQSKDFVDLEDPIVEQYALDAYGVDATNSAKITVRKRTTRIISLAFHIGKKNQNEVEKYLDLIRHDLSV